MLDELSIRGLGVIDEAVLSLGPGLTVVTGETGAGKTMVVTGLLLLFGGRADPARVRTGREQAAVEGRLVVPDDGPVADRVRAAGGELDDGPAGSDGAAELVLRRAVSAAGRSRAHVGGAAAPVAVLGELAEHLVAVHGQSDQLRLVRPAAQRVALDRYAGLDTSRYAESYARWRAADTALRERTSRAAELRRESDLLAHGVAEIDAAAPQPGEMQELATLAARLGHADALRLAARIAHDALLGDPDDPATGATDVVALLATASRALAQHGGADPDLDELFARLVDLAAASTDIGAELSTYAEQLDSDPDRLEQVESRRATLQALVRKYCDEPAPSTDAVLRWAEAARARLAEIDVSDDAIAALQARRDEAAAAAGQQASELSAGRRRAAAELAQAVTTELAGLAMPDARLEVQVRPRPPAAAAPVLTVDGAQVSAGPDGVDQVELLLAAHPGAPALPIGRGASGGELSRVMLALEVCLAASDASPAAVPTLVFDEVDAGVGGRAAVEVGRRLARLARDRQVLVVTHLPQVAAFADHHVTVDKPTGTSDDQRTSTGNERIRGVIASDVRVVSDEERIVELARMLAGSDTATAREHATELLADARAARRDGPTATSARARTPRQRSARRR